MNTLTRDSNQHNGETSAGRVSYRMTTPSRTSGERRGRSPRQGNSPRSHQAWSTRRQRQRKRRSRSMSPGRVSDADLFPPDLGDLQEGAGDGNAAIKNAQSFQWWLTSGILDVLGAAAGATLTTTGKLVAPPLHVTRTVLLPALLDLLVDTLDSVTPQKVKDWFRILSSSMYHLMVVLRSTDQGKLFSLQLYVVLQDILQALSSPESRQVLVDGMAASVKFADALHTPEMKEFLDQFGTLGVRVLDAAASGKSKQLLQDTKDLAWKGISMATDPATTVALAEVTAHICHALEDANQTLNPIPRSRRNAQNESIYINPYQMVDFPHEVSIEEVILSGLGVKFNEEETKESVGEPETTEAGSSRPRVTWNDEISYVEPNAGDWQDHREKVDAQLLKESILRNHENRPSRFETKRTDSEAAEAPNKTSNEPNGKIHATDKAKASNEGNVSDIEDIQWSRVPGAQRMLVDKVDPSPELQETNPAVLRFYEKLDTFLNVGRVPNCVDVNNLDQKETTDISNDDKPNGTPTWNAKIRNLRPRPRHSSRGPRLSSNFPDDFNTRLLKKHYGILLVGFLGVIVFVVVIFLACFGFYVLVKQLITGSATSIDPTVQEIVIRVVRDGNSDSNTGGGVDINGMLRPDELEAIAQSLAEKLR